jgi:hypothetical protein
MKENRRLAAHLSEQRRAIFTDAADNLDRFGGYRQLLEERADALQRSNGQHEGFAVAPLECELERRSAGDAEDPVRSNSVSCCNVAPMSPTGYRHTALADGKPGD